MLAFCEIQCAPLSPVLLAVCQIQNTMVLPVLLCVELCMPNFLQSCLLSVKFIMPHFLQFCILFHIHYAWVSPVLLYVRLSVPHFLQLYLLSSNSVCFRFSTLAVCKIQYAPVPPALLAFWHTVYFRTCLKWRSDDIRWEWWNSFIRVEHPSDGYSFSQW